MYYCFTASILALTFVIVRQGFEQNVNISNKPNFSDVYRTVNYIGLLVKFICTLSPFGVHSLCTRSNVVDTSLNLRK